jgi:D-3-phosphoglycerate dehydrogenase
MTNTFYPPGVIASRTCESVVRQVTCAVKNLLLAMNGKKPIAQVNPEVPVKKVIYATT